MRVRSSISLTERQRVTKSVTAHQYPYATPTLSQSQVVFVIARSIYQDSSQPILKKVRQRIHDLKTRDPLQWAAVQMRGQFNAAELFTWALKQKGWQALTSLRNLPHNVAIQVTGVSGTGAVGDVAAISIPNSSAAKVKRLIDCEVALVAAAKKQGEAEAENARLRNEVTKLEKDAAARKKSLQDAGSAGGRALRRP